MRRVGQPVRSVLLGGVLLAASACVLAEPPAQAQTCQVDADCASDGIRQFRCVPGAEGAKVCEIRFPASGAVAGDAFYCTDIKPLMDKYCVSCHSPDSNSSGKAFMLSHYETQTIAGGAAQQGVYDKRDAIKKRMVDKSPLPMPPSASAQQPSQAELGLVAQWVAAGAPYAKESAGFDASVNCGGGAPVSFANDVQPLFTSKCTFCHTSYLTAGTSYEAMVGKPYASGCDPTMNLIEPGDPDKSLIWGKLQDPPVCEGTARMPLGPPLSATELALIKNWILQGAPNN